MITSPKMPICIPCGIMFTTWTPRICGTKQPAGLTTLAYIIRKAPLNTTMLYLLMMRLDIVLLDNGK